MALLYHNLTTDKQRFFISSDCKYNNNNNNKNINNNNYVDCFRDCYY